MTLEELDRLERCAAPIVLPERTRARTRTSAATFERAAGPYRALVQSARSILIAGRSIRPELEKELRDEARRLSGVRNRIVAWIGH